jgi:hypothetical protein
MTERGEVTAKGPSVGLYLDRDIPAWVAARDGRYVFNRLWDDKRGEISQLGDDEIVIAPGLIYKIEDPPE